MSRAGAVLALLAACGPKEIPPHLRMDPPVSAQAQQPRPQTLDQALTLLVGTDPLLRRAPPGEAGFWDLVPDGEPLRAWAAVAQRADAPPSDWGRVEANARGSIAVPLVRGARLAALEAAAAGRESSGEEGLAMLPWLGPIVVEGGTLPPGARGPLEWISQDPEEARKAALRIGERAVLLGWLDGPQIPVIAAAAALQPGVYDRLIDSPTGALLLARAAGSSDAAAFENGRQQLIRATSLALQAVAADRDSEQEAWRATQDALKEELGERPVAHLLRQGAEALTRDAANPEAVGLALVALSAERIQGDCPDSPCRGLDRVGTLEAADRWSPGARQSAAVWRVIALKAAMDTLEVTRERVGVPTAWLDLADALAGSRGASLRQALLRTRSPDASTWLDLSRLAGGGDATTWEGASKALNQRLVAQVDLALALAPPDEDRQILERIRRRAL